MRKTLLALPALILAAASCNKEEIIKQNIIVDTTIVKTSYTAQFTIADQQPVTQDVRPPALKAGDSVAVCAASNMVSESEIIKGMQVLESWGLKVARASNLLEADGRYAGTLEQRVQGFQQMIDKPGIRAIFMARGGYGAAQILPFINWSGMEQSPKWIVGYSDATALLIQLQNMGYESVHGPMMKNFDSDSESLESLKDMLFGQPRDIQVPFTEGCVTGQAEGRLVGGNLSLLQAMSGTAFDLNTDGAILFIEDTGESNYSIDRMLLNLQQSGKLAQIKGMVTGQFIGAEQGPDIPLNQIIAKYAGDLGIPVAYGIQSGHGSRNLPLLMGCKARITVTAESATIEFPKEALAK